MSFTDRLRLATKDSHTIVDKHPFVTMIRKNKLAGQLYINFNKICINEIQKVLLISNPTFPHELYSKLYRDMDSDETFGLKQTPILDKLLDHCKKFPLESAYQYYLGLLFGGNMLKRMLPEHQDFLTFEEPKQLINIFKTYLCENVTKKDEDYFINNVNQCYKIIKQLFDEFYIDNFTEKTRN